MVTFCKPLLSFPDMALLCCRALLHCFPASNWEAYTRLLKDFWKTRVQSKLLECSVFFRNTSTSLSFLCFMRGKGDVLRYFHSVCIFFASVSCVNSVHMKRVSVNSGDILANWQKHFFADVEIKIYFKITYKHAEHAVIKRDFSKL